MKPFVAHCTIEGGKIVWRNQQALDANLPQLEGMKGILTVKAKWPTRRSPEQNSYMHLCFKVIGDYMGENPNEVKRIMKGLFAPRVEKKFGKRLLLVPKNTRDMSKEELSQFMLEVSAEAASMRISLPDPELYKIERDSARLLGDNI